MLLVALMPASGALAADGVRVHGRLPPLHFELDDGQQRTALVVSGTVSGIAEDEITVRAGDPARTYVFKLAATTNYCGEEGTLPRSAFALGDEVTVLALDGPLPEEGGAKVHWQRGQIKMDFRGTDVWIPGEEGVQAVADAVRDVRKGLPVWHLYSVVGEPTPITGISCDGLTMPFPG
jgi:hypothetical protein